MTIFRPSTVIAVTASLSFAVCLLGIIAIPTAIPIQLSFTGTVGTVIWYLIVMAMAEMGYLLGVRSRRPTPVDSIKGYTVITIGAIIGVTATFYTILSALGIGGVINAIAQSSGNAMKQALYTEYSIGPMSLRYLAIASGAIALRDLFFDDARYRYQRSWSRFLVAIVNLGLLVTVGLVSSRLSIVAAVIVGATDSHLKGKLRRISPFFVGILIVVMFTVLTVFNWTRNANYYRTRYSVDNPVSMSLIEIVRYVGYPWAATTAGVDILIQDPQVNQSLSRVPMVLIWNKDDESVDTLWYTQNSMYDTALATNSALLQVLGEAGIYGAAAFSMLCLFWGCIYGSLASRDGVYGCGAGMILYSFSEVWRINLFVSGVFLTVLLSTIVIQFLSNRIGSRSSY